MLALLSAANQVGNQATAFSAQRLRVVCQIGGKLIEWKAHMAKRAWESFLEEHLPDLHERTRRRWMSLAEAERSGRLDLETARGLRHAYQLAGLLPDPEGAAGKGSAGDAAGYQAHLNRLLISLGKIDLATLSDREKHELRDRLKAVAAFILKL